MRIYFTALIVSFFGMQASALTAQLKVAATTDTQAYATFTLADYSVRLQQGQLTVTFTIPKELTGGGIAFSATGVRTNGTKYLAGDKGTLACTPAHCEAAFKDLGVDEAQAADYLRAQGYSEAELNARIEVLTNFLHASNAVITFDYAGASPYDDAAVR